MNDAWPDLEIYLHKPDTHAIVQWLQQALAAPVTQLTASHWQIERMDVFYNAQAHKNFASLWFKQNHTPWKTDVECARAAHQALDVEIRCAAGGWDESQGESEHDTWLKLIRGEEKLFTWKD